MLLSGCCFLQVYLGCVEFKFDYRVFPLIFFFRIIEIYTKIYGKNDGRVGMAMCSLANAKCAKGKSPSLYPVLIKLQ